MEYISDLRSYRQLVMEPRLKLHWLDVRNHALYNQDDNAACKKVTQLSLSRLCKYQIKEYGKLHSGNVGEENQKWKSNMGETCQSV